MVLPVFTKIIYKAFVLDDGTRLTSGRIPFATTNGRLTDDADLTFATDTLTATKVVELKFDTFFGREAEGKNAAEQAYKTLKEVPSFEESEDA